jgi:hypothetical protein
MALNFNVSPYFDDFDPNKNFHRILFKPGYAVQARELTQSQTILQDQISKFADHIFQKNTPISGGNLTLNTNCFYVKLNATIDGDTIDVSLFENQLVQNSTADVIARVLAVAPATGGDPDTLILSYLSGLQFNNNDVISAVFNPNVTAQALDSNATGNSSVASISEGVFYVVNGFNLSEITNSNYSIGHFVNVLPQTTILDKYSTTPSVRVGLNIVETIQDYVDDVSLLDQADGAPNFQGPGADRYIIRLDLETRPLQLGDDDGFIELMRIEGGQIKKQVDGTIYATIDDYFAKRTFDTNGDYIVTDFKLSPSANTSNTSLYDLSVGKGVAYVRGYRIENQSDFIITSERARETETKNNDSTFISYGNFLYTTSANGFFDFAKIPSVDLHLVSSGNINTSNANTYNSTLVSSAKLRGVEIQQQAGANTAYIYRTYLTDFENKSITTTAAASSNSTSVYFNNTGNQFSSVNDSYNDVKISVTTGGITEFRKIQKYYGTGRYADLDSSLTIAPTTNSIVTLSFDIKDVESITQMNKATEPYKFTANSEISVLSKENLLATGNTSISEPTTGPLIYPIGYPYVAGLSDTNYTTNYIFRGQNFGSTQATISLDSGDPFQFTSSSPSDWVIINNATGAIGTISNITNIELDGSQKIAIVSYSGSSDLSSINATVITKIAVNDADNSQYVLKRKNLVQGDTSTVHLTGTTVLTNTKVDLTYGHVYIQNAGIVTSGQSQPLYVSDVKRIVKIVDSLDVSTDVTDAMLSNSTYDVTNNYILDNGQRDSYYGHASIKLKPGRTKARGKLLVILDYYDYDTSSGDGYFSVRSYLSTSEGGISSSPENYQEIPSYRAKNGTTYSLRDSLDFRPTVQNAQPNFVIETHNNEVFVPINKDNFDADYSYYLARKDLVVLSKDNNFEIIQGTASINPLFPVEPDGSLVIAKLSLDPYTAYVPGENPRATLPNLSIEKILHKRWTMRDISNLQNRVNNIEYYTALNTLEKSAQSLQIPDVNGFNRFKNGILVDDFSSFATADTENLDYYANINRREKKLSAPEIVDGLILQNQYLLNSGSSLNTSGLNFTVKKIGSSNYFMLPYTTANLASQVVASNTVNLNPFAIPIQEGIVDMNPPMDNWVDNTKQPDLLIVDPDLQLYQSSNNLNILNVGDWKTVPGTTVTQTSSKVIASGSTFRTTETTTQTFGSINQAVTLGYYDKLGSSYYQDNGYITDISVLPFIRPQQVVVRARGLLINTPIKTWFDGLSVDRYISAPDTIELTNVFGEFREDDIVGYTDQDSVFYPTATVASVYKYPNTNRVRLSIFGNRESSWVGVNKIHNMQYDINGNPTGNTAFGSTQTSGIVVSVHRSGQVTSVGHDIVDKTGSSWKLFSKPMSKYGKFANRFGIWSSVDGSGQFLTPPNGQIPINLIFNVPKTGNYFLKVGGRAPANIQVLDSSNNVITLITDGTYNRRANLALSQGTSNISFRMTGVNDKSNWFAFGISDQSWGAGNDGDTTKGNVIFNSTSIESNTATDGVATTTAQALGGIYYTGVTRLSLSGVANTSDGYYNGNKISVTSTNITFDSSILPTGGYISTPMTTTANIISYVGANSTVFLDSPVRVSMGQNQIAGDITSEYTLTGTANNTLLAVQTNQLDKLSTDESGNFSAVFNIPSNTFKTGERIFRIDNRIIDTDPDSATTTAQATFTASGLSTKSQAINFSPSISAARNTFNRTNFQANVLANTEVRRRTVRFDPVCQTFIIEKENFPNGVFINSIKIFFARKPTDVSSPVTLSILGTTNGYPNGETLDNSIVTLQASEVKVSNTPHHLDPTTYTEFVFPAPVYIESNKLYGILLRTPSDDYVTYLAAQNAIALPSTIKNLPTDPEPTVITKIGTAPYVGALFESQNLLTWTANQGKALMFVIERCVFDTSANPQLPFVVSNGLPQRKLSGQEVRQFYDANNVSNLYGVSSYENKPSHAYNLTTTDFVPSSTNINYNYRSVLDNDRTFTSEQPVSPGKFGCPTYDNIFLNDGKGPRILLGDMQDSFKVTATLSSSDNTVSPMISDDSTTLYNIQYQINNMELSNSLITLVNGGTGYNVETLSVVVSLPDDVNGEQALAGVNVTSGVIDSVYFTNNGSGYYSTPTITITDDTTRSGNSNCEIIVNGETSPNGGNGLTRYVTRKVSLTPGNESGDLRVFYTAYRPLGSNINVYYKVLNANDTQPFEDSNWVLMTNVGNDRTYSRSRDDLYEYEAAPGTNNVEDNFISYTSVSGQTYSSFNQFAIKIVLSTSDKTNVPFLTDMRTVALPPGTGV